MEGTHLSLYVKSPNFQYREILENMFEKRKHTLQTSRFNLNQTNRFNQIIHKMKLTIVL